MAKLLLNPWVLLGITLFLMASHTFAYTKGHSNGVDAEKLAQAEAIKEAEKTAAENITKTKREAEIVYKYIREQDNTCDIYDLVIERLPEPTSNR